MGLSRKAQREQLRAHLLRSGASHAAVAAQMCRLWSVRPRTGWRYAVGWEMWKLAQEFVVANPQLRADVSRISRWEAWPLGQGGRKPSLEDLAALALTFGHGCTVADLVDQADSSEYSTAERHILAQLAGSARAQGTTLGSGSDSSTTGQAVAVPVSDQVAQTVDAVKPSDVAALCAMAEAFAHVDHRLGGGHGFATVTH